MTTLIATECLVDMYDRAFLESGFTVFVAANSQQRYAVSATSEQTWIPADASFADFSGTVERVWNAHPEASAIGGWVNGNRLYLDPVESYKFRDTALAYARDRGQQAIYDLATGEEVPA